MSEPSEPGKVEKIDSPPSGIEDAMSPPPAGSVSEQVQQALSDHSGTPGQKLSIIPKVLPDEPVTYTTIPSRKRNTWKIFISTSTPVFERPELSTAAKTPVLPSVISRGSKRHSSQTS